MANETRAGTSAAPVPDFSMPATKVYRAGGGRKLFYAAVFLVLMPFFLSLPAMFIQRVVYGVWLDTWGLIVIGIAMTIIVLLVIFELLNSILARVEIGQRGVRFVLPYRQALLPTLFYRKREIMFTDIERIEKRREIYGGRFAPVMMQGAVIITKDGGAYSLGYVSEADLDPLFPVPEIANEIARRANVDIVDKGAVHRPATQKLLGLKQEGEFLPISDADIAALNTRHRNVMFGLVGVLVVMLLIGMAIDFATPDIDRGERARDAVKRSVQN